MKKFFLLLIVFTFIYPIFPKFLPIPLDRVLQIFGATVFILYPQDFKKITSEKTFYAFYGITSVLLILAFFAQLQLTKGLDLYFIKQVIDTYFYVFSAYLICWMMRRIYGYISIGLLLYYFSLAAILQTLISFVLFFNSGLFDTYISLLKVETNQGLFNRTANIGKRFIGFGSQFFSGVIKYGFAFLSVLILPYVYSGKVTNSKLLYWLSVIFIAVGGILTGRTFFIAIVIGILMVILLRSKNIFTFFFNNLKAIIGITIALVFLYFVALIFIEAERFDALFNFAFELFINFFEKDSLETGSTNRMQEMYFFPDNLNTWLFGDGKIMLKEGGYYMGTDIGYIRLLFYFGLPCTLFFVYVLLRYYQILRKSTQRKELKYLFFFLTLWMLILNLKGLVYESRYFVAFLLVLILQKSEYKKRYYI